MSAIEASTVSISKDQFDGVTIKQGYFNASEKSMKYVTFTYEPYNRVNDQVACTLSGKVSSNCKLTGPIEPASESYVSWDNVWYNATISKVLLTEVHIEYMDGTEETIAGEDIVDMYDNGSVYSVFRAKKEAELSEKRAARETREKEEAVRNARKKELKQAYYCFKVFSCFGKMKDDAELKRHVNQGLWLFIIEVLAVVLGIVIPGLGSILTVVLLVGAIFFASKCVKGIDDGAIYELPVLGKIKLIK